MRLKYADNNFTDRYDSIHYIFENGTIHTGQSINYTPNAAQDIEASGLKVGTRLRCTNSEYIVEEFDIIAPRRMKG